MTYVIEADALMNFEIAFNKSSIHKDPVVLDYYTGEAIREYIKKQDRTIREMEATMRSIGIED